MNMAPIRHGLAYRIEGCLVEFEGKAIATSRIMYESAPIAITADQALAALDGSNKNRSEKSEAIDFLTDALSSGPVSVKEVAKEAAAAGISPKSLRSAREAIGVKPEKTGFEGGWVWSLPKMPLKIEGARELNGASWEGGGHLRGVGGITTGSSSELADGRADPVKH
jgi:putative DNA primase/helicase